MINAVADEVTSGNVDSVFHIGDISYATGFLVEWDFFLHLINPVASRVSYMTAIGNHERSALPPAQNKTNLFLLEFSLQFYLLYHYVQKSQQNNLIFASIPAFIYIMLTIYIDRSTLVYKLLMIT